MVGSRCVRVLNMQCVMVFLFCMRCSHGRGVGCGKILIETYLKSNQIRSNDGGNGDSGCEIDAGFV